MMHFRLRFVRDRLTFWYAAVFGLVLIAYICGATFLLFWQLTSQMYHAEIQDVETAEGLLYFAPDGTLEMQENYHNYPQSRLLLDRLMEVMTPDGKVLFRNELLHGRFLGAEPFPGEGQSGYYERSIRLSDGTQVLLISHIHSIDGQPLLIRLAYSTEILSRRLEEFVSLMLLAFPVALVIAALAGYRMAGKALNPLEQMASQTEMITTDRLSDRVPVENPDDELGHMARVLNSLLARFEQAFEQSKRFTSDVSHELRTPLASIRSVGEVGLQRDHTTEGYRNIIGSMLEEVGRLTDLVETLLTISRADAGQIEVHKTICPLMGLVRELVGLVGIVAEERNLVLTLTGDGDVFVHVDRSILRQAVLNILDNAVKYSPAESEIRIQLERLKSHSFGTNLVELTIEDQGPGVPEESKARIFDRFYRLDEARSRDEGGAGLGLSIAKWAVDVNGGDIGMRPTATGIGSCFYIRLPLAMPNLTEVDTFRSQGTTSKP
jgi:heavy metal sensor kinase